MTSPDTDPGWAVRAINPVGLFELVEAVCRAFNITERDLVEKRRHKPHVVVARQVISHLARELTIASFPEIGRAIGRDHTCVMQGRKRLIRKLDDPDPRHDAIRSIVIRLRRELAGDPR